MTFEVPEIIKKNLDLLFHKTLVPSTCRGLSEVIMLTEWEIQVLLKIGNADGVEDPCVFR